MVQIFIWLRIKFYQAPFISDGIAYNAALIKIYIINVLSRLGAAAASILSQNLELQGFFREVERDREIERETKREKKRERETKREKKRERDK